MRVQDSLSLIVVYMFVRSKRSSRGLEVQRFLIHTMIIYKVINYMDVYLYIVVIVINVLLEENFH